MSEQGNSQGQLDMKQPLMEIRPDSFNRGMIPQQGTPLANCPMSFSLSTKSGRAKAFKAASPGDMDIPPSGSIRMVLCDFLVFPDTRIDEDSGEITSFVRTVLYDRAGRTLRLSSPHAPYRLAALLTLYTVEQLHEGIEVDVSVRVSKRGRTYHDIQLVE